MLFAIVVAAGSGLRFCKDDQSISLPKQYITIDNQPIILISVLKLLSCEQIDKVIICVRQEDAEIATKIFSCQIVQKKVFITIGGKNRIDSTANGLNFINENFNHVVDLVLIHDVVRPMIKQNLLQTLIEKITLNDNYDAVLPILQIQDALKKIENDSFESLDRSSYFAAQTPQIFRFEKIIECFRKHYKPHDNNSKFHDEIDFMEKNSYKIGCIDGCKYNIKITTEEDLKFAEYFLIHFKSFF